MTTLDTRGPLLQTNDSLSFSIPSFHIDFTLGPRSKILQRPLTHGEDTRPPISFRLEVVDPLVRTP